MPQKIRMFITNSNIVPPQQLNNTNNISNLASKPSTKPSSLLNAAMISRIHNVRPGCGSCGRK
jgi:hypothetical protein